MHSSCRPHKMDHKHYRPECPLCFYHLNMTNIVLRVLLNYLEFRNTLTEEVNVLDLLAECGALLGYEATNPSCIHHGNIRSLKSRMIAFHPELGYEARNVSDLTAFLSSNTTIHHHSKTELDLIYSC